MLLIKNRYYDDYGLDYVFERLSTEFEVRGNVLTKCASPIFGYERSCGHDFDGCINGQKEIIFWDKDIRLAKALESRGIKLFPNCADTLAACDDKEQTYSKLVGSGINLAKTICAPLVFDINVPLDDSFLNQVSSALGYPIVVKENVGSQGKQVYLAKNRAELESLNQSMIHKPHIYQEFRGEFGCDIRVYVIGGEAIASVKRKNTTNFKSNVALGGDMELYPLDEDLRRLSVTVSKRLNLNYGAIDFVYDGDYVFIEANSNAYFKGIEALGVPIGTMLAEYIIACCKVD